MAADLPDPVDAVLAVYRDVAAGAEGRFPYPVGRDGAERLGYAAADLDAVPAAVVERFVGVGRPLGLRPPRPGERVLDIGCGCGLDAFLVARAVGRRGRSVGLDLSRDMLAVARAASSQWTASPPEFLEGDASALPLDDASFDVVLSNGALNLVADKPAAFAEIARVLRPGGSLAVADLLRTEDLPANVRADPAAWAG